MIGVSLYDEAHMAQPCAYIGSDSQHAVKHKGHRTYRDCYNETWNEPPLPWVKRIKAVNPRYHISKTGTRSWHLVIGLRKESGIVQVYCNVGDGPGPFAWRDKPALSWQEEPGEWFCRRCVAEWTRGVHSVTVRVDALRVTKPQLKALHDKIRSEGLAYIELRPTDIEDHPALLAVAVYEDPRGERSEERFLVVGEGVVKL